MVQVPSPRSGKNGPIGSRPKRKKRRSVSGHPFDIAVSYASEDLAVVEQVVRRLDQEGNIRVFFSRDSAVDLWGKDETEFDRIYGTARFVVPFISSHYARKEWPRREFTAARRAAKKRDYESILPVRIDDAKLPGLRRTVQYVSAREYSPEEIARFLIAKLKATDARHPRVVARPEDLRRLAGPTREALGLLAAAPGFADRRWLRELFPGVHWTRELATLRRLHLVSEREGGHGVPRAVERSVLRSRMDERRWRGAWTRALEPYASFSDGAMLLAVEYLALRRIPAAVATLVDIALGLEPGRWNDLYSSLLAFFDRPGVLRRLRPVERIRFRDAVGLTLSRAGFHSKARATFKELLHLSERTGDMWGVGQALINGGVAAFYAGDQADARCLYEAAVAHARATGDDLLLGRALTNLAHTCVADDPRWADELLAEGEALKSRVGDDEGLVVAALARGDFAAMRGELAEALECYRRAAKTALANGLAHLEIVAQRLVALTLSGLGEHSEAFRIFRKARRGAAIGEYEGEELPLIHAEAIARMRARHYRTAEKLFEVVAARRREAGDARAAAVARYGAGAALHQQGLTDEARKTLLAASEEARGAGDITLAARCALDAAMIAPNAVERTPVLKRAARIAVHTGDRGLSYDIAFELAVSAFDATDLERADRSLVVALRHTTTAGQRAAIALARFATAAAAGWRRRVEKRFEEARELLAREGLHKGSMELHLTLGDYLWEQATVPRREVASHAYTAAVFEGLGVDLETSVRAGAHFAARLSQLQPSDVAPLRQSVALWLRAQTGGEIGTLARFADWPFAAGERLAACGRAKRPPSRGRLTEILSKALEAAFSPTTLGERERGSEALAKEAG